MDKFEIDACNFTWINGEQDDPDDRCLHGTTSARIGGRELEQICTVSASALYLLKSLTEDHIAGSDEQLMPCCGFFLVADNNLENVSIIGCDAGEDWSVIHDGDNVRLVLNDGYEAVVPLGEYKRAVFAYADKLEAYYNSCAPKNIPEDEFDRNGYIAFWNEWRRRRADK